MGFTKGNPMSAYHCHDVVAKAGSKAKRFCVPIGYKGGYDWPYHQGYPGVGTGLWGWGWPWIKNKVPGSKGKAKTTPDAKAKDAKAKDAKVATATDTKEATATDAKSSTRSLIPDPKSEHSPKSTKKQTIHVGYGYASGDNYRLGYGFGGMGGVSGFNRETAGAAEHSYRSKIPNSKKEQVKNSSSIPESSKDVTASGRQFESNNQAPAVLENTPDSESKGGPMSHPGFTTMGAEPAYASLDVKNTIPPAKNTTTDIKKVD